MNNKSGMTIEEEKVMGDLMKANNGFMNLSVTHPDEQKEWVFGIHILQGLLMQRIIRRDHPEYWYTEKTFNITFNLEKLSKTISEKLEKVLKRKLR